MGGSGGPGCGRILLFCCLFAASLVAHAASPATAGGAAERIDALLRQGNVAEAYALGVERFAEHGGEPRFDFAFGMAALEADQPDHAVLAFQRVLNVQPRNDRARLELARAYFILGENANARDQFERVLERNPPPLVQSRIGLFLERLDQRERAQSPRLAPFVGLRFGHDDNVSSVTDGDVTVFFGNLPLVLDVGDRLGDEFAELHGGFDYQQPLSRHRAWFVGANARQRSYFEYSDFDQSVLDLRGGGVILTELGRVRVPLQLQVFQLDGDTFRSFTSLGGELSRRLGADTDLNLFTQLGNANFPQDKARAMRSLVLGTNVSRRFAEHGVQLLGGAYAGVEQARRSEGEHHGRGYLGLRASASWQAQAEHALIASVNLQSSRHDAEHPAFGERREDTLMQLSLNWVWGVAPSWQLRTGLDYIDNDSSLDLYDYDRTVLATGLRYNWR